MTDMGSYSLPTTHYPLPPLVLARRVHGGRVDPDPGAHRRGHGDALQVLALRRRGLRLDDALDERVRVLHEPRGVERGLADRRVHDAGLVHAELHLAGLDL